MVKECKDSLKNKEKKDYTLLLQILDDALFEHSFRGGNVPKKVKVVYTSIIIQRLVAHSSRIMCHVATISATICTCL
jgi:succinate dehydrogenase flavin-adding protein (antitoxin of CptAB toxin-antitoxin module)